MRILDGVDALPPGLRFAATVGVFDGMHRGHGVVVSAIVEVAERLGAEPVVITFEPHPQAVLRGRHAAAAVRPGREARPPGAGRRGDPPSCAALRPRRSRTQTRAKPSWIASPRGRDLAGLVMIVRVRLRA